MKTKQAGRILAVFYATFCVGFGALMLMGAGIGTGHTLIDLSHLTVSQAESSITADDLAHGSLMFQDTDSITTAITELDDGTGALVQWNIDEDWISGHVSITTSDTEIDEGDAIDVTGTGTSEDPYVISVDVTDIVGNGLTETSNNLVVNAGDGIDVGAAVAVDVTDFLGTGTYDDGSNNIAIGWTETGGGTDMFRFIADSAITTGGVDIYLPVDYPDPGETALAVVSDASYHMQWVNPDDWDDQYLWLYMAADTGDPTAALSTSDYLKFVGGTNINTDISGASPPADCVIAINLDADIVLSTVEAETSMTLDDETITAWGDIWTNVSTKAITIEDPTDSEDITLWFSDDAVTVNQFATVLTGSSPSVAYTVRFAADRSAAGTEAVTAGSTTTSTTTGDIVTVFDVAVIPADNWVWLETTATSGTITSMNLTIRYSYN